MEISVKQGSIVDQAVDALLVNIFEGVTSPAGASAAVDQALGGAISEMIAQGDLTGKIGEVGVFYPRGTIPARRVLVIGLGKAEKLDLENVRKAAAAGIVKARDLNAHTVATIVHGAGMGGLELGDAAQATSEGSLLALYRFDAPKRMEDDRKDVISLTIVELDGSCLAKIEAGVRLAERTASGVFLARDLVNLPPNIATPTRLAETAEQLAMTYDFRLTVGDREWAAERKMGAYLAVAKGAGEAPKFIVLEYNPDRNDLGTIVLVGKGITFDTGGISLKPSDGMGEMKSDMGGAAAVLGAMKVVGQLKPDLRIIAITPCTENMPDASAYHPADIITASNGKTIEIITTDAEGRMILADALVYAQQYHPAAVIDLATLTGSCVIALGEMMAAGLFCNDETLTEHLLGSADKTHERLWRMPLWDDYMKAIETPVADMKNAGGRYNGVGTSAIFLKEFTDYPWAHLDIASMAFSEKAAPYIPGGGTGYGVRLLIDFLLGWNAA